MNKSYRNLSIITLVLAAVISAFATWRITMLGFDYNFEAFFPRRDKDTDFFNEHRERFGTDNDFIQIAIKNESGIFQKDFLTKVAELEKKVSEVENVTSVISPISIKEVIRDPLLGSSIEIPYLRYDKPEYYSRDSIRIYQSPPLIGSLFSENGKSLCLIINHREKIKDKACIKIDKDIREVLNSFDFEEYHIAGRSIGQAFYTQTMKIDLVILLIGGFIVIIGVMGLIYRRLIGVLLPFIIVGLVISWSLAFMQLTGKGLDVMSNAIPTILLVTGLSVSIHLITKYIDHLKEGADKVGSLRLTIKHVGLANIFTTLTTVVGFGSLATSGIKPIDDFGLYTAFGVALSFLIGYTVLPALLYVFPTPKKFGGFSPKVTWEHMFYGIFKFIMKFKVAILIFYGVVVIGMLFATFMIRENTYLMEDLSEKDQLKKDFVFFEKEFQGTRPFEMSITVSDGHTIFDKDVVLEMEKIENYLQEDYGLGFIAGPVAVIKGANKSLAGGDNESYSVPESDARYDRIVREIKAVDNNDFVKAVCTPDYKIARMRGIIGDIGSYEANIRNKKFEKFYETQINKDLIDYKITGTAELIDKNNRNLAMNILQGLLIAFGLVAIIFGFLFKNWKMVIIGLVPNIVPLVILAGIMGLSGINMKMSTAILFTIAFGIAVDDTIHFLSRFRTELKQDKSILYAIKRTYLTSGKAMMITTLILCIGFGSLGLSSFMAIQMIGLMVSLTLVVALLCDLTLLPALIILFYRDKKHRSLNEGKQG